MGVLFPSYMKTWGLTPIPFVGPSQVNPAYQVDFFGPFERTGYLWTSNNSHLFYGNFQKLLFSPLRMKGTTEPELTDMSQASIEAFLKAKEVL